MRFLKSISLFCFIVFLILTGTYFFFSYRGSLVSDKMDTSQKTEEVKTEELDLTVSTKQDITTCDTIYEVESHIGNSYEYSVESIPFSFLGLNREELMEEIARYELSPSFEDKKKGFLSIELLSFHPDRITVKKVYAQEEEKIIYYLKAVDHELFVYRSDKMDEVFMPTDLTLDMLPADVQQQIIATKCFNNIGEVYAFLESYTS